MKGFPFFIRVLSVCLAILILLFSGYLLVGVFGTSSKSLFPTEDNPYILTVSDQKIGGDTEIKSTEIDNKLVELFFRFGEKSPTPYAGLSFFYQQSILLKGYDSITISTGSETKDRATIILYLPDSQNESLLYLFETDISLAKQDHRYRIPFDSFSTPAWWFKEMSIPLNNPVINQDFNSLSMVQVLLRQDLSIESKGRNHQLSVSNISLSRTPQLWMMMLIKPMFIFLLGLLIFFVPSIIESLRGIHYGKRVIPYRPINYKSEGEVWTQKLLPLFKQYYLDSKLSKSYISGQAMMGQRDMLHLIKENTGLTFPSFINSLRIEHAKKLLIETDYPIVRVAFDSGFGSLSRFNAIFKKEVSFTPGEYRRGDCE